MKRGQSQVLLLLISLIMLQSLLMEMLPLLAVSTRLLLLSRRRSHDALLLLLLLFAVARVVAAAAANALAEVQTLGHGAAAVAVTQAWPRGCPSCCYCCRWPSSSWTGPAGLLGKASLVLKEKKENKNKLSEKTEC